MRLPANLVARLDLVEAIKRECASESGLVPSRTVENALLDDPDGHAEHIRAELSTSWSSPSEGVLWASKTVTRLRPASVLPIESRVAYAALALDGLDGNVQDRFEQDYGEFERSILDDHDVTHIVTADVSSFYQYVDHNDLQTLIVEETGRGDSARALLAFLEEAVRQPFGLPQGPIASDWLSELILRPVERTLLRLQLGVSRFNDDFRIGTTSWRDALNALQVLHETLRRLGLTLNDEKTAILTRAVYEKHLGEVDDQVKKTFEAFGIDLESISEYPSEDDDDVLDPEICEPASALLDAAMKKRANKLVGLDHVANLRTIRRAIDLLGRARCLNGLKHAPDLMATEPALTRIVSKYMVRLLPWGSWLEFVGAEEKKERLEGVAACFSDVVDAVGEYAPAWQSLWLLQPVMKRDLPLNEASKSWIEGLTQSSAPLLRSRAALALAIQGAMEPAALLSIFDSVGPSGEPDAVAALALTVPPAQRAGAVEAALSNSYVSRVVTEFADKRGSNTKWLLARS